MRNTIFTAAIALTMVFVSCNQKSNTDKQPKTETSSELYSCPMHPEVQGAKGDKCPKCGMELTEPVSKQPMNHESHPMNADTVSK